MLANKIIKGAVWLVGARLMARFFALAGMLIVASILTPDDFGLVAIATSALTILSSISDLSLSNALIQMRDPPRSAYDTAFTVAALRGGLLAASMVLLAWPMAHLYDEARLFPVFMVLSLPPLIGGLTSPCMVDFARQLKFHPFFLTEFSGQILAFAASVSCAVIFHSYWALIAGQIAVAASGVVLSYVLAPYRPRLSGKHWKSIFAFSSWLTLSQIVNTLNWQADRLFIGHRLGRSTLGIYTVGDSLASLPTQTVVAPITQALYSGFADLRDDIPRFRDAYLAAQTTIVAIALPLGFLLALLAHPLIILAVGPKWLDAAFSLTILGPVFAIQTLTAATHSVCMASGNTRLIFARDLLGLAIRFPLILIGLYWGGFHGVIYARIISGLAIVYFNMQLMSRVLGINMLAQLVPLWRSIFSIGGMIGGVGFLKSLLFADGQSSPDKLWLGTYVFMLACAGMALYLTCHFLLWFCSGRPTGPEQRFLQWTSRLLGAIRPMTRKE
ncbi:lipopolysaccharide biosynthesis protein [Bradyrhizobium yuanmingense]|uniref:lipopolysaccharide biosynthesis protein n=1 Tax=Bradyrhizobium yuanmingense TaxID=108015 RepID=UPI0023B92567|nr:lipopolysaccharide biosynthesis protein [Bradyrhizobium yuanmingense]MDF0578884.1 lipopolysaccharide biosynthesis protein [Bradyrhizobium yuanmingense]